MFFSRGPAVLGLVSMVLLRHSAFFRQAPRVTVLVLMAVCTGRSHLFEAPGGGNDLECAKSAVALLRMVGRLWTLYVSDRCLTILKKYVHRTFLHIRITYLSIPFFLRHRVMVRRCTLPSRQKKQRKPWQAPEKSG